jgi:hypothetical protein
MKISRRNFVKIAGAAGTGMVTDGLNFYHLPKSEIKILSPIDGDMLNEFDGTVSNDSLQTKMKISAPPGSKIKINGVQAKYIGDIWEGDVKLKHYKNSIEMVDVTTGTSQSITVFWLKNYTNRYRLSLDDNIWFLRDISNNADKYKSIFENPYLAFFKQIHDTYGTKVHINIYYQTDGFNLSQMTTKYKSEWKDNSGWLRLSFHALQNEPSNPYLNSGYEEVKRDCEKVNEQILRFAGEEVMGPVTTLHWGEATVEGSRALRDAGYVGQVSDFLIKNGVPAVSMYMDLKQTQHMIDRSIWKDNREGIIFSRISIVINSHQVGQIVPFLDELKKDPHKSAFLDLLMHEQYFHPSYVAYQPDFRQKVTTAVKWAADKGYKPAFLSECIFDTYSDDVKR